jgi:GNAT superfamily N-acetyltransferase
MTAAERATEVVAVGEPSGAELDDVRALMTEFVAWCRVRYAEHIAQVDTYFDAAAFRAELDGLPGVYAPPHGRLLLARVGGRPAGCVALRPFDARSCEMKRMFVRPEHQGRGAGRALAETLVREARGAGYARMLLDTGFLQHEAQSLYRSLGFVEIEPYYPVPAELRAGALFMELTL